MAKAKKKRSPPLLLFVDANIWLDFYRGRSEASLALLQHVESVQDKLIVTYQLEMEYKKNRQNAILEGMKLLAPPPRVPRLGIFSNAAAIATAERALKQAEARVTTLKKRLSRILEKPADHDPVYQACQRMFHRDSPLVLTRDNPIRRRIRNKAMRRFLMGYPPRKPDDTSMGDAINWEWMIECATAQAAGLVIVTRDLDYGGDFDKKPYLNDCLRHEFSDRVSQARPVILCRSLSAALKHFHVSVTQAEEKEEKELIATGAVPQAAKAESLAALRIEIYEKAKEFERHFAEVAASSPLLESVIAAAKGPPSDDGQTPK